MWLFSLSKRRQLTATANVFGREHLQIRGDSHPKLRLWALSAPYSINHFIPPLESRTWKLVDCIQRRASVDGIVDLTECVAHFAYDFMVKISRFLNKLGFYNLCFRARWSLEEVIT